MFGEACEDRRRLCAKPFWTALGFAPGGHGGAIEGAEGCGHLVMGDWNANVNVAKSTL